MGIGTIIGVIGGTIGIIGGGLAIWDRLPKIKIALEQRCFETSPSSTDPSVLFFDSTLIQVEAIVKNKGKEPVTIGNISFSSDNQQLNDINPRMLFNSQAVNEIRIEQNDMKRFLIQLRGDFYLPNIRNLNANFTFHTSKKDIQKNIQLIREINT